MIPIEQAEDYFDDAISKLNNQVANQAALTAAHDGLALVKLRIQNKGQKSDGSKFPLYSKAVVPFWYFKNKSRTGSEAAVERLYKKTGYFASYEDWRRANNLQVKHKDFKFTGRMWSSIIPKILRATKNQTIVEINSYSGKERDKVKWLTEQQGNFLTPSQNELDEIAETYLNEIIVSLRNTLG